MCSEVGWEQGGSQPDRYTQREKEGGKRERGYK